MINLGNGRAEALSTWLKELLANVLIQPFHCIIYLLFMQNVIYSLYDVTGIFNIGKAFICIIMLPIIYKAEDIIKKIFGLESKNLEGAAAMGLVALSAAKKAGKFAQKGAAKIAKASKSLSVARAGNTPSGASGSQKPAVQQTHTPANNIQATNVNNNKNVAMKKMKNALKGKGVTANALAGKAMGMALGYGLTGDYDTARAGKKLEEGMSKANQIIRDNIRYRDIPRLLTDKALKNEDMLDAYENLKEAYQYTDEQMYQMTQELLDKDVDTITDDLTREYAQSLQVVRDTQIAISDKEEDEAKEGANEYVLEKIQNHILK